MITIDELIQDSIKELADLYKKRGSGTPQQNVKGGDPRKMTVMICITYLCYYIFRLY